MDPGTLFGYLLGMVDAPMLKCTCNPSVPAGGMDKVCCTPFQTTVLVKSVRFEKTAQKLQKNIRHVTLPPLAAQGDGCWLPIGPSLASRPPEQRMGH